MEIGVFSAFKLALRFLTRIPVRLKPEDDSPLNRRLATVFYPLVGLTIGLILAAVIFFTYYFNFIGAHGPMIVTAWVLISGGLHLDGLMDVFDGFFYAGTPERRLEIMKDVQHGTYAVAGVILYLLLKAGLIEPFFGPVLIFAPTYARWVALKIVRDEPVVNPNGMAAQLKKELHPKAVAYGMIIPTAVLLWVLFSTFRWSGLFHEQEFNGMGLRQRLIEIMDILMMIFRIFVLLKIPKWFGNIARRYIGGINGDVLGAAIELSELAVLLLFRITPEFFIRELPSLSYFFFP